MKKEIKIVTTIGGIDLPINECRKFNNQWYKVGDINIENSGDCYNVDGRYYRIETGSIIFDHELKQYSSKKDGVTLGIIGAEGEKLIQGYFTVVPNKNIEIVGPINKYYGLNDQIFINNRYYRERLYDGKFYHISRLSSSDFNKISKPSNDYKHSLPYDSKDCLDKYIKAYEELEVPITNSNIEKYAKNLKNYTFGLEFETTAGIIPSRLLNKTGLIPLRDGSITGIEYVTVPISGAKGLQTIVNDCKILSERTEFNNTCSLHLHIGGIPRTKEFILAFFRTMCFIQDEIFDMFPLYKKYNFGLKNKNYSAPFPAVKLLSQMDNKITNQNINDNFDILYKYLTGGLESFKSLNNDLNEVVRHPADQQGNQKWNISSRYTIANLVCLIFGNKKTIEFRIHTPTFDVNKIIPFIYINTAILDFVVQYQDNILKDPKFLVNRSLQYILESMYPSTLNKSLIQYMYTRKEYTTSFNADGDIMYDESKIPNTRYMVDWESDNIKLVKNTNQILEDIPAYTQFDKPYYVFEPTDNNMYNLEPAQALKQSSIGKGIVEQMKEAGDQYYKTWSKQNTIVGDQVVFGTGGEDKVHTGAEVIIKNGHTYFTGNKYKVKSEEIEEINKKTDEWK